mgnify:FL=1
METPPQETNVRSVRSVSDVSAGSQALRDRPIQWAGELSIANGTSPYECHNRHNRHNRHKCHSCGQARKVQKYECPLSKQVTPPVLVTPVTPFILHPSALSPPHDLL